MVIQNQSLSSEDYKKLFLNSLIVENELTNYVLRKSILLQSNQNPPKTPGEEKETNSLNETPALKEENLVNKENKEDNLPEN